MQYKFCRDGIWENVVREKWRWEARFDNGTILKQFGDDGIFHQFKEIDQGHLQIFRMVSDDKPCFTLLFNPLKMKLIHYYKRVRLNFGTSNEVLITAYCFGYETTIFNRTVKMNLIILPTGEVVITENNDLVDFKTYG